jgi:hypothetical protein
VQAASEAEATATAIRQAGALTMDAERQAAALTSEAILGLRDANVLDAAATADHVAQQLQSQIAGQQLAQVQATLASLGSAVAQGFQTAGAAAQTLAAQYGIAYDAALALIQAQAQLAQAKLNTQALSDQRAGERDGGSARTAADVTFEANQARLREASRLRREQEALRGSGARSGGGTAASARLTDQQKLNNTLLNDQAKYQDQAEAQEREHTQKLLKIQADFEAKSLAQQRANEVSKRQGRADFYDALTSSSKDLGEKESQALSASYEQAFAKAQEIAQAGNQKLADDYLSMRQQQLQKEIEYQKARKAAADDGDKGEVARLDAIRKLQQEADAEKEKQLLAGGDANVNARDDALASEDQRYLDQQEKAATAAENAGERKRAAAIRNGAAIDVENEKLREQERILARVGGRPPGTGAGLDGALPPPSAGATPPASPGASPDGGESVWRVFDSGVVDALNSGFDRVVAGLADVSRRVGSVESAVRGLSGRVMQ